VGERLRLLLVGIHNAWGTVMHLVMTTSPKIDVQQLLIGTAAAAGLWFGSR
jgi:hypothetical protein